MKTKSLRTREREARSSALRNGSSAARRHLLTQPHGGGAVMDDARNLGVTEAWFALPILTCLLVAIGYIAVLRLGGAKDPTNDSAPDETTQAIAVPPPNLKEEVTPRVLPIEPDDGRMAKRP